MTDVDVPETTEEKLEVLHINQSEAWKQTNIDYY